MAKTVFDVLREKIESDKDSALQFLSSGGAKDFAEYKESCGVIRGLTVTRREIQDLARNYMDADDD